MLPRQPDAYNTTKRENEMSNKTQHRDITRELLMMHYRTYPELGTEDVFKYLFQSAFGCEHLVSSEDKALEYIEREYEMCTKGMSPLIEKLDGAYSRVYLSYLDCGLAAKTLARLFVLSARQEPDGRELLEEKMEVATQLVDAGALPIDSNTFHTMLREWRSLGYPPVHHSDTFRSKYHPSYRVIADRYVEFLQLFSLLDNIISEKFVILTIDGDNWELMGILQEVYGCEVLCKDEILKMFSIFDINNDGEQFFDNEFKLSVDGQIVRYRMVERPIHTSQEGIVNSTARLAVIK